MKHLMRYEGFSVSERVDEILDKITKYGLDIISQDEIDFLNAHQTPEQEKIHKRMLRKENEVVFEDDQNHFRFELEDYKDYGKEKQLIGTFYVPNIKDIDNGEVIEGQLKGQITIHIDGQISPDFTKDEYDIFDFCEGIEHELDSFVEYIVIEVMEMSYKN